MEAPTTDSSEFEPTDSTEFEATTDSSAIAPPIDLGTVDPDEVDLPEVDLAEVDLAGIDLDGIERDLDDVQVALTRLNDGTYWTDEITGDVLPDELLTRRPTARTATNSS